MELRKQRLYFSSRLAFDAFRHQRCRGFRNGTPFSLKTDIGDNVAIHPQVHGHSVATKRVVAFGAWRGAIKPPEVSRSVAMVDDQFLIEIRKVVHRLNNSWTRLTPSASASISDFVL